MQTSTCTKCHNKYSIYYRPYSGERLCSQCFQISLKERVQKTINNYHMLEHKDRIAVGISGGKDSLTLLHLLNQIEDQTHGSEIIAITVDEGIVNYRDEAILIVEKTCKNLDIELVKIKFNDLFNLTIDEFNLKNRTLSICSYCGVLRRRALNEGAKKVSADKLATGHTLDDMAQTALLNLLRGDITKMQSLYPGGIKQKGFVQRIKPICEIPEKETTFYAFIEKFDFQSYQCPYSEEAMRNDTRTWLLEMEEKRPGIMFTCFHTALKLIPNKIDKNQLICDKCGEPSSSKFCRVCQMLDDYNKINF